MKDYKSNKEASVFWQAVSLAFQLGYTVTIPLVILALVGRFLDKKFNSSPLFLLVGIVLSMIISSAALFIKMKKITAKIDKKTK